jgi:hypothetical protein
MKKKELFLLEPGTKLFHKRYGEVEVINVIPDFGAVVKPLSTQGEQLLSADSGCEIGTPLLEGSSRQLDFIKNLNQ